MRIAALIAVSLLVPGLIAACSHPGSGQSGQPQTTTQASSAAATTAPAAGAAISAVITWIEAAHPVDPARYHSVTRDGVTTQLGNDLAFTVPPAKVVCTTDSKHTGSALACLVNLDKPPPRPETAYGEWKGGWVDFDGTNLQIGHARGDPGPFVNGNGPELADGESLSYDDYRCRADQVGLFCVNYAHQSAVRFSSAGIEQFGCLHSVPPPDGVGIAFSC
jgi:hypothetical protein